MVDSASEVLTKIDTERSEVFQISEILGIEVG